MKICDIARGSKIYTACSDGSAYIIFHNMAGMYSYCETAKGGVVYLSGITALTKQNDGYIIEARPPPSGQDGRHGDAVQ